MKREQGIFPYREQFITRESAELYFSEVVSRLTCTPKTATRIRPALQYYADNIEYVGMNRFVVCSDDVNASLRTQCISYAEGKLKERKYPDKYLPCYNISDDEHILVLREFFSSNIASWKSSTASWNLDNNAFLRCDSFIKLRLSNLVQNSTHGPKQPGSTPSFAPMLTYLLNPLDMKGGRGTASKGGQEGRGLSLSQSIAVKLKTRIVGCWRHKTYLRCATGMVSLNLFTTLYSNHELNFYDLHKKKRPKWWNQRLFMDWKDTKAACTAYNSLLNKNLNLTFLGGR